MIPSQRTSDTYFKDLPAYDFAPNYVDTLRGYEGLRIHYLDEGPNDAEHTFLCLHGQPTWSYLYRKMVPIFVETGARVIAPDWLGFGRSDKPNDPATYGFHFHRNMMIELIGHLNLNNVTLVCQDWGGILGLTIPMEFDKVFSRLLVMNTALALGEPANPGFEAWRVYNRTQDDLDIAALMKRTTPILSDAEAQAYSAPFPDKSYKSGVRRFPDMVMTSPDMEGVRTSKRAARWWTEQWMGKSFMAVGVNDPVLGPSQMQDLRKLIRGCPEPMMVDDAGHFLQEWGERVAKAALAYWDK